MTVGREVLLRLVERLDEGVQVVSAQVAEDGRQAVVGDVVDRGEDGVAGEPASSAEAPASFGAGQGDQRLVVLVVHVVDAATQIRAAGSLELLLQ